MNRGVSGCRSGDTMNRAIRAVPSTYPDYYVREADGRAVPESRPNATPTDNLNPPN